MEWFGRPTINEYRGLNLKKLPLNHAFVIANTSLGDAGVYSVRDDCFNCPFTLEKRLKSGEETKWMVDAGVQKTWRILNTGEYEYIHVSHRSGLMCQTRPALGEYGVYRLDIGACQMWPEIPAVRTYLPLYLCIIAFISMMALYGIIKIVGKLKNHHIRDKKFPLNMPEVFNTMDMKSLYVFRGVLLTFLIFVTTGGGGYPIFTIKWGNVSVANIVYAAFAWTLGVRIPSAMEELGHKKQKIGILCHIFKKSFILFAVGTMLDSTTQNMFSHVTPLWWPLQRLALAYFVVASAYVVTVRKPEIKSEMLLRKAATNVMSLMWCWILSVVLLAVLISLMAVFASLNCQGNAGQLDHRLERSNVITDVTDKCNNRIALEITKFLLADTEEGTPYVNGYYAYNSGIFGVISTTMATMIGLKAGTVYHFFDSHSDRIKLWSLWTSLLSVGGALFIGVSYLLQFNLWPVATILFISSATLNFFTINYIVVEKWKRVCPVLSSLGETSLAILAGHQLFSFSIPFYWNAELNNHLIYLLQNFWTILLWAITALILRKKKVKFSF